MEACQSCGRPRGPGLAFCTGCGQRFPATAGSPAGHTRPKRRFPMAVTATAVVVVIVAVGASLFFSLHHGPQHVHAVAQAGLSSPTRPATQAPAVTQGPESASPMLSSAPPAESAVPPTASPDTAPPSPTPGLAIVGSVTVSAAAAQNPAATAVATFASQYFSAINSHDFPAYYALLAPQAQQGETPKKFSKGFSSSSDSDEILTAISQAAYGDTAATLTFTSRQNASQAAASTGTCTDWTITLFLESNGTGYLDGPAPSTYRSVPKSCQ
jgi:hypothetical protein